ncbi:hypothetical protein D6B99_04695 [Arachidicoccus soli]|uniref:Uncharacterized protein n=1 Tax=Arachidicoccus soli TaxID=2341117 RepID=A0A386HMS2_9BACT|nr:hypothetical protein D6B99_04695 [Arachidicoccus soli]
MNKFSFNNERNPHIFVWVFLCSAPGIVHFLEMKDLYWPDMGNNLPNSKGVWVDPEFKGSCR